jgi:hypothetical protein
MSAASQRLRGDLAGCEVTVGSPVGLQKYAVDLGEVDGFGVITNRFEQGGDAEVATASEQTFGGAEDQIEGLLGEGVVSQTHAVEFAQDVGLEFLGEQGLHHVGVGDAGAEVVVDQQPELVEHGGLGDEYRRDVMRSFAAPRLRTPFAPSTAWLTHT